MHATVDVIRGRPAAVPASAGAKAPQACVACRPAKICGDKP